MPSRHEAAQEAAEDRLADDLGDAIELTLQALAGYYRAQMAGRQPSGFQKGTGYHEASFLYGKAVALGEVAGRTIQSYPELMVIARQRAQARFLEDVAEHGEGIFAPPGR